ncbi:MAG: site-specific integrase [Candidatus Methanomethyliaceae archaeon]
MPKYKFKRQELTTKEEVERMIRQADKPWLKAIIAFLYLFGCRCSEALLVKKEDLWVENDTIHVKIPILKRKDTNGPYERPLHILRVKQDAPFADVVLDYWRSVPEGKRLFPHSRWWTWKQIKKLNPNMSPHVFRHDRLTKIALKRPDPYLLKEWAGWSDTRPAEHYVEAAGYRSIQVQDLIE